MAAIIQDVLKANLVFLGLQLLDKPEALDAFRGLVGTDVTITASGLVLGAPTNAVTTGQTLALPRDRITLESSPVRSVIAKDYPSMEEVTRNRDLDRFAEVAHYAVTNTHLDVDERRDLGYNIELVYEQDTGLSAFRYLAERLFRSAPITRTEWQLIGGSAKLHFQGNQELWNVTIEPRFQDHTTNRIFLSLNLHRSLQSLPNQHEIKASLNEAWNQAVGFVMQLDEA